MDVNPKSAATSMDANPSLAASDVDERADVWWSSLLRTRFEDGAVEVAWDEFGSMTILEYEARFSELSKYAPHIVTDERRKVKKFVMGMRPSLRTRLVVFDHRTLDEALSAACRQEGEMEQYLEEKKASQKRPAALFQRQERKKVAHRSLQHLAASGSRSGIFSAFPQWQEGVSSLREGTWWFRMLEVGGEVLEVREQ
ncbi:hypothetical protein Taro_044200 [Colocasia esculenta]|uniref:Retrotransposon gag domain-containing protein n=1 Tax=Colocasia esculenta TaxID=4460 RepID=A0A843X285_COLES|nr:hypothetical protein [Colocasia esculenta]